MIEDFGYEREQKARFKGLFKKSFIIGAALFSVISFIYISVQGYHYVTNQQNNEIIRIKSPSFPIKVTLKAENATDNNSIYDDIFGSKNDSIANIIPKVYLAPEPVKPPKKIATKQDEPVTVITDVKKVEKKEKQPIIIYSEADIDRDTNQDLLTKEPTRDAYKKVKVQIAALSSQEGVNQYWQKITQLNPDLFRNLRLYSKKVDLGKRGIFYRVQIGNFSNQISAEKFCERYVSLTNKSRADCIIVE